MGLLTLERPQQHEEPQTACNPFDSGDRLILEGLRENTEFNGQTVTVRWCDGEDVYIRTEDGTLCVCHYGFLKWMRNG